MKMSWWRRIGPWITPALVIVEVALVWSGVLSLLNAVIIAVILEALIAVTVIGRGIAAMRRYRSGRTDGRDGWIAAQEGLAQLFPKPAARAILIEVRIWTCLLQWLTRRRCDMPESYAYGQSLRPIMWIVFALLVVEGVLVESVLASILGNSAWVWITLGLHLYAWIWIGGFLGSMHVLTHHVGADFLQLRDSVFNLITIPYPAIVEAQVHRSANVGRTGFKFDATTGCGQLAYGDSTVRLALHPDAPVELNGETIRSKVSILLITADDPEAFVYAVNSRQRSPGRTGEFDRIQHPL